MAARILKLLSRYKYRSCTLTEIADRLSVNKTTCLRVLRTLEREDFIRYHPETRRYSLGPYLIPLGNRAAELNQRIAGVMAELPMVARATGMTTVLVQRLRDDRLIYIASAEPPDDRVRIAVSIGQQFPITGAAFGKCFLAYDEEDDWDRWIAEGLKAFTPNTITHPERFKESLREVRQQGYAVTHAELTPGVSAVAVPIFDRLGRVEWVMACLALTAQLDDERIARAIARLRAGAERLSEWSGYPLSQERKDGGRES
ncbi:IclR family transcriptional regulator [Alicyclobacillus sp.]|uniref:IclR family transcriptional regulator n=1 Tax=Alicyclobacillus sp. TaxID=61169 RepID=UPI0025BBC392|nr:IclR family transcriptional regulator [Alicyclobacillus sp.]